ncbi:hypothetical protein ACIP2Y_00675 [Streptomyces sviceus]|uniref:hypothetical protein n=1 Tax=Streptomyces sviceus TaxID=285530 RepID=UPI00382DFD7A
MLTAQHIDVSHFSHRRADIPEDELRKLVQNSTSYADVMRGLGLEATSTDRASGTDRPAGSLRTDGQSPTAPIWLSHLGQGPVLVTGVTIAGRTCDICAPTAMH